MHHKNRVRRVLVTITVVSTVLLGHAGVAAAASGPAVSPAPQASSGSPQLTPDYIARENAAGRADLPSYLLAYPSCITTLPLIVASNPTREALIPTSNSGSADCVLGVGNQGYAVQTLQQALNACRGAGLAVDGIYGQATKTAVKNVQIAFGITADGVYGPVTRSKPIFPALPPYSGCFGFSY